MAGAAIVISILANANQANQSLQQTSSLTQRVGSGFRKMALPAVAALGAIGAAAFKATQAAADDASAQARLAQSLKTAAGATKEQIAATESWITAQGKALGVSDDELRPAIAKLATATGSVSKAQKLASVAMDISAGSGKSLEQVTAALAKAQSTGSVTALAKYGVATKDAQGETKSLSQITSELAGKYKGAASTAANTAAGKQKKLTLQLGELQEQIGAKLLPVMTKLAAIGLKTVGWISKNEGLVTKAVVGFAALAAAVLLVNAAMKVATAVMAVHSAVTATAAGVQSLLAGACIGTRIGLAALAVQTAATSAVTKAAAAAQWLLNVAMSANPIGLVVIAIVALVAGLVIAYKRSETFRKIVDKSWAAIKKATVVVFDAVRKKLVQTFNFLKNLFLNFTGPGLIIKHWSKIRKATTTAWNAIRAFIRGVWTAITAVVRVHINTVRTIVSAGWNAARRATSLIWAGIRRAVSTAINAVMRVINIQRRVVAVFAGAGAWLYNAGRDIVEGLLDGIDSLIGVFEDKLKKLTDLIPGSPVKKGPLRVLNHARRILRPHGRDLVSGLIDGWDSEVPAVKKSLGKITKDIGRFDASLFSGGRPSIALSATAVQKQVIHVQADVRLTAQQLSRVQNGKEIRLSLDAFEAAGGRSRA